MDNVDKLKFDKEKVIMSAWGTKIFDNDLALDIKTDFIEMLSVNMSINEIENNLLSYISNDDEAEVLCPFWTALSDLEWQYGILQEKSKIYYFK